MRVLREKRGLTILVSILLIVVLFTGCSKSEKDKALEKIKNTDVKAYMQEDQKNVKELVDKTAKEIKKAKDDKAVLKIVKTFKSDLKMYVTKNKTIKEYTKLIEEQIKKLDKDKQKEAEKILEEYKEKLGKIESKKELEDIVKEINSKISKKTGKKVEVKADKVLEKVEPVQNAESKNTANSSSSNKVTSSSSKSSGSTSSGTGSGTSKPKQKEKVWVVDRAAWTETKYKTETYTEEYTCYITSDGREFPDYESAYAYYLDNPCNFRGVTKTRTNTRQVPYTVSHPEQGHWE